MSPHLYHVLADGRHFLVSCRGARTAWNLAAGVTGPTDDVPRANPVVINGQLVIHCGDVFPEGTVLELHGDCLFRHHSNTNNTEPTT